MRKLFALLLVLSVAVFTVNTVQAQDAEQPATEQMEEGTDAEAAGEEAAEEEAPVEEAPVEEAAPAESSSTVVEEDGPTMFQVLKKNFIDGGWSFMSLVLITLILGLAFCIFA